MTVMTYKEQALALERGLFGERRANSVWERELRQNVNVYRSQTRLRAILLWIEGIEVGLQSDRHKSLWQTAWSG